MVTKQIPSLLLCCAALHCQLTTAADEASGSIQEKAISAQDRAHWAYQPLHPIQVPTVPDSAQVRTDIDRLVWQRLHREGLDFSAPADPATLLRRVTFDLTGLPPTAEALAAFLADPSQAAYTAWVDRLLDSPEYGENEARHWLDLVRFADTDGFEYDAVRKEAWRYRDWVIDAFNHDLPYDEFVRWQIAGDLLASSSSDPHAIATGFLLSGPDMPDINDQEERRHFVLNEIVSTVGAVFLSTTTNCAQCHDHPNDPLSQADFFRLRAVFEDTIAPHERRQLGSVIRVSSAYTPPPSRIWIRGDFHSPGPEVSPAVPRIAAAANGDASGALPSDQKRAAFAQWLTRDHNAMFLRSIANRLWQFHFSKPLVETPNDFGLHTAIPAELDLLDWLAAELPRQKWSLKAMSRLIVTSTTYRQSSRSGESDPGNALFGRMPRRRLTGEEIRDAMLAAAGVLNPKRGGPGVRFPLPEEITVTLLKNQREFDTDPAENDRRSIYLFARRNLRHPLFDVFDRPDALASCPRRSVSTTAPQALTLLNGSFSHRMARLIADRIRREVSQPESVDAWITQASHLILSRDPSTEEVQLARAFFESRSPTSAEDREQALHDYCLALLNANAFLYVD